MLLIILEQDNSPSGDVSKSNGHWRSMAPLDAVNGIAQIPALHGDIFVRTSLPMARFTKHNFYHAIGIEMFTCITNWSSADPVTQIRYSLSRLVAIYSAAALVRVWLNFMEKMFCAKGILVIQDNSARAQLGCILWCATGYNYHDHSSIKRYRNTSIPGGRGNITIDENTFYAYWRVNISTT